MTVYLCLCVVDYYYYYYFQVIYSCAVQLLKKNVNLLYVHNKSTHTLGLNKFEYIILFIFAPNSKEVRKYEH